MDRPKEILKSILLILCLTFVTVVTVAADEPVLPLNQPEYLFLYDRTAHNDALTLNLYDFQLGPYQPNRFEDFDFSLGPFEYLRNIPENSLRLFGFAQEDFRSQKEARAKAYEKFRGGLAGYPLKNTFVYGNFILDEERADDSTYTGKKWRGLAGEIEEAFINYQHKNFSATFGRFGSFWGPQRSLVLGSDVNLDGFGYSLRWGKLAVSYRLAQLNKMSGVNLAGSVSINRYFAGHRFDFHFNQHLRVGLFETVVWGGPGRPVELYYLNPLIFFHGEQLNENDNDNTFVGFDFTYKYWNGYKFYGQLLIDDVQLDDKSKADDEPNEIGFTLGAFLAEIMSNVDIKLAYTQVRNWTFNQMFDRNRYLFRHQLISAALGNDYDQAEIEIDRWFGEFKLARLKLGYLRQGEGSVTADWTNPWLDSPGKYSEKFPTGTVEKTATVALGFKGFVVDHFFVDLEGGVDMIDNFEHIDGENKTRPFFKAFISTFFSLPVSLK